MADASRLQERTERWECGVRCIWLDERIYRTRITRYVKFLRDIRARGIFQYQHVSTHDQLADAFTKPLPRDAFTKFRCWMGMG